MNSYYIKKPGDKIAMKIQNALRTNSFKAAALTTRETKAGQEVVLFFRGNLLRVIEVYLKCGDRVLTLSTFDGTLLLGDFSDDPDYFKPQFVLLDSEGKTISCSDYHTEDMLCIALFEAPQNAPKQSVAFCLRAEFTSDVQDYGIVQHRGIANMWHHELTKLTKSHKQRTYDGKGEVLDNARWHE